MVKKLSCFLMLISIASSILAQQVQSNPNTGSNKGSNTCMERRNAFLMAGQRSLTVFYNA